jgi:hypothetical protein
MKAALIGSPHCTPSTTPAEFEDMEAFLHQLDSGLSHQNWGASNIERG